ncbi:Uncharacterised protein [Mycobacteroides abscessus]|nr:Uncharacterised protein [Mycobacteroides abscessus]
MTRRIPKSTDTIPTASIHAQPRSRLRTSAAAPAIVVMPRTSTQTART